MALIMVEYLRLSEASQSTSVLAYYVLSHPLCAQSELGLGKFVGVLVLIRRKLTYIKLHISGLQVNRRGIEAAGRDTYCDRLWLL